MSMCASIPKLRLVIIISIYHKDIFMISKTTITAVINVLNMLGMTSKVPVNPLFLIN